MCDKGCNNGGSCSGPNTCSCVSPWIGKYCDYNGPCGAVSVSMNPADSTKTYTLKLATHEIEDYLNNQACSYTFTSTDANYVIRAKLTTGTIEDNDLIEIYSGGDKILETNADYFKYDIQFVESSIIFQFTSDASGRGSGFHLYVSLVAKPAEPRLMGYVKTDTYDIDAYQPNLNSFGTLFLPTSSLPGFFWLDLHYDAAINPGTDRVLIFDGQLSTDPVIANVSEEWEGGRDLYVSIASAIKVGFQSGDFKIDDLMGNGTHSSTGSGFKLYFQQNKSLDCNGPLTDSGTSGIIETAFFPNGQYNYDQSCTWLITTDPGYQIWLQGETGILELSADFLEVYDGSSDSDPLLNSTSSNNITFGFITTGNTAFVRFTSNSPYKGGNGFRIVWKRIVYVPIYSFQNGDYEADWTVDVLYGPPTINGDNSLSLLKTIAVTGAVSAGAIWSNTGLNVSNIVVKVTAEIQTAYESDGLGIFLSRPESIKSCANEVFCVDSNSFSGVSVIAQKSDSSIISFFNDSTTNVDNSQCNGVVVYPCTGYSFGEVFELYMSVIDGYQLSIYGCPTSQGCITSKYLYNMGFDISQMGELLTLGVTAYNSYNSQSFVKLRSIETYIGEECNPACPSTAVCVGENQCTCLPGYTGINCDIRKF